jgi:outer membrane protein insertion porin family
LNRIHHRLLSLATALLLAFALPASAQDTTPKINDIIVVGNKNLNREFILNTSGLKVGDLLTQAKLDQAQQNLLSTQYFGLHKQDNPADAVKITAEIIGESAKVVITVDENDLISGITIRGSGPIKPEEILPLLQTKTGNVLHVGTLRNDFDRITRLYESKGYQAFVSDEVGISKGILDLPIVVGTVNSIKITGLKKTKTYVLTREMKLGKGAYYNVAQLRKDITRIYNTDLFENVDQGIGFPEAGKVDITINAQEKRSGNVSFGFGYNNRQKLVGRSEISENNLFGTGQKVNLLWIGGGPANRQSIELGFTEPWIDRRNTTLSVNIYDRTVYLFERGINSNTNIGNIGNSTDYYEVHRGGQITISRPFRESYRGWVGLRMDAVSVPALQLTPSDAVVLQNGTLAVANLRLTHSTRDYDNEPVRGDYDIYSLDIGRAVLRPLVAGQAGPTGTQMFQKLQFDFRRYFSLGGPRKNLRDRKNVVATRLMLGSTLGMLPFWEQYFVGGAETLRGFSEIRFWGRNMFLSSVELRSPLANSLTGVLFTDVGSAWAGPYSNVRFNGFTQTTKPAPQIGFGFGIRVVTPIGPIRIDQGFSRDGTRTHFSLGHVF